MRKIYTHTPLFIFFFVLYFYLSTVSVLAFKPVTFVNFINPVRGPEGWELKNQTTTDMPRFQYEQATSSAYPISWALRYDAIKDKKTSSFFNTLTATDSSQLVAGFLEVTPNMAIKADVPYQAGDYLLQPQRVFLSGYSQQDRIKLIDTYMSAFWDKFSTYPRSVLAWHIDSYSLEYLSKKYSVTNAVIVDDQYSQDYYRVWGSYWGSPYYPSRLNVLVPSDNKDKNGINIVVSKWAARDPFNGYNSSLFSVQINDFPLVGENMAYLDKLLAIYSDKTFNEFTQVNIGMENDYSLSLYKQSTTNLYSLLQNRQNKYGLRFSSLPEFSDWFMSHYPESSPAYVYFSTDPTGKQAGKALWYQSPYYRIGLKSDGTGNTKIIDFRIFNSKEAESFYAVKNISKTLYLETSAIIDSIKYPESSVQLDINLDKAYQDKDYWDLILHSRNKTLRFEPKKIIFSQFTAPQLNTDQIKVKTKPNQTIWEANPSIPFSKTLTANGLVIISLIVITLLILFFIIKKPPSSVILIFTSTLVATAVSALTVIRSGSVYTFGMGFWGPTGHDAIFHLSLIKSLSQNLLSLSNPQFSGAKLQNYHLGFDYISATISRFLSVSPLDIYFRYLPVLIIPAIALVLNALLKKWQYSNFSRSLAIILTFLTGSFGFIVTLIRGGRVFSGESVFWANQSISILLNPPFALSILLLLIILYLLEKPRYSWVVYLLSGMLIQAKVYAFILLSLAFLLLKKPKLFIYSSLFAVIFILPSLNITGSSFPFIFAPGWFLKSMVASYDRLNWTQLAQAWQVYEISASWVKLFSVTALALFFFIVGNLGIRIIGLYQIITQFPQKLSEKLAIFMSFLGILIPLLFTQSSNPWNTIQFMYYSLFFLGIFTAQKISGVTKLLTDRVTIFILFIPLLIIAFPTTIGTLKDYITSSSASRISLTELQALDTLSKQKRGTVLSPVYDLASSRDLPGPKPLYAYTSTAYISAFSGQPEFLSDLINLDITGFNYKERLKQTQRFFQTTDAVWAKSFLLKNNISYVYMTPISKLHFGTKQTCLNNIIFDSGEINIYKVNCHE